MLVEVILACDVRRDEVIRRRRKRNAEDVIQKVLRRKRDWHQFRLVIVRFHA